MFYRGTPKRPFSEFFNTLSKLRQALDIGIQAVNIRNQVKE